MRRWEKVFTGTERAIVKKMGTDSSQFHRNKSALLIIDVTKSFIGSTPEPILKSVNEYVTSCGESGWAALPSIQKLQESCRARKIPVLFSIADISARRFCWGPTKKAKPELNLDPGGNEIPEPIKPRRGELVIAKCKASVFFGTPLLSCLRALEIESLLIAGCTTSGCVQATVVDAFSYGFSCFVVEECVFDRFELSHLVSLFGMNAKYADVITLDEALNHINNVKFS